MEIVYLGQSSFLLKTKDCRVVCDPYDKVIGFKMPKVKADLVTVTHGHKDHNNVKAVDGDPMVISGPGEYEVKGVMVTGLSAYHDDKEGKERGKNIIYIIESEELRIVHLGDLGHKLDQTMIDKLDGVDVLMIPVGGDTTIDAKKAVEIVKAIGPSVVIPMHYKTKDHALIFKTKAPLEDFVKELGMEKRVEEKLKLKKLDLPEEMELVVLKKNG